MAKVERKRHCCSKCFSKIYEDKMYRYYYPLLRKIAWHCEKCVVSEKWGLSSCIQVPSDKS